MARRKCPAGGANFETVESADGENKCRTPHLNETRREREDEGEGEGGNRESVINLRLFSHRLSHAAQSNLKVAP